MKQHEAVIKVMEKKGGYATLGYLYQKVLKIPGVEWKTKTPHASIRRIVQDDRFFFKIKPGLWALKSYRNKLPQEVLPLPKTTKKKKEELNHYYYQGLLLEIGNLKKMKTAVPPQDRNQKYLDKKLEEIASIADFYDFTYKYLVSKSKTVDVVWFNERKMPDSFFEIEHTTNMQNSLLKFIELQDFHANFYIAADNMRRRLFESKIKLNVFKTLANRVTFLDYDKLSDWHTKTHELATIEKSISS